MTAVALQRYEEIMAQLLQQREQRGDLSEEEESEFADKLDGYWVEMSRAEQLRVEAKMGNLMPISVVVQSIEGRPVWNRMQVAIEASDIGTHYERMLHPAGMPLDTFFLSTLERLAEADTDLVLRFEDDVVFCNDHILYNALTWPALEDPRFGAGWLLAVGGWTASLVEGYIYKQYGKDTWRTEFTPCTSACLFWRKDLPEIIDGCREYFALNPGCEKRFDWAICHAVARMKKEICLHAPSLVDHDESVVSTLGHGMTHPYLHTAQTTFRKEWRRP